MITARELCLFWTRTTSHYFYVAQWYDTQFYDPTLEFGFTSDVARTRSYADAETAGRENDWPAVWSRRNCFVSIFAGFSSWSVRKLAWSSAENYVAVSVHEVSEKLNMQSISERSFSRPVVVDRYFRRIIKRHIVTLFLDFYSYDWAFILLNTCTFMSKIISVTKVGVTISHSQIRRKIEHWN